MQNNLQNNDFQGNGFGYNRNGGFDAQRFINDGNVRKISAVVGVIRGVMMAGICSFAILSPIFKAMRSRGDETLNSFGQGFVILLILLLVVGVLSAVRNLITLILMMTGKDTEGFGQKYIMVMGLLEANMGRMVQIVMGAFFVVFSVFAFAKGPNMLAEGSTVEGLYIVSGIFIAAGLGLAIGGTVGIIKSVRNFFSGAGI